MRRPIRAILVTTLAGFAVCSAQAAAPTLTGADVGAPSIPGSLTITNDGSGKPVHVVTGGGGDIWNTADSFYYAYFQVTGDFDYVVKVSSHIGNSGDGGWSKAELMARQDDGSGAPSAGDEFIANMANRPSSDTANGAPAGVNNRGPQWRSIRDNACTWTTPNPAFPPNANSNWLRLERVGNVFYMYTSDDGQVWHMYNPYDPQGWDTSGSWPPGTDSPDVAFFTNAWTSKILLGLAVTGHNDSDVATVAFTDFGPYTPTPPSITTQPAATVSVSQNNALVLSVTATGDPVHYQWLKNGTPISRAVGPTCRVDLVQLTDAGTYKCRVYGGGTELMSVESVVTVTVDTSAPTVKTVTPELSFTGVRVEFSEPVTDTALTAANYTLDNGITVSSVARVTPSMVLLTTSKMAEATTYNLTINGVKDTAVPDNTIAANTKVTFLSLVFDTGMASYERWNNSSGTDINIATLAETVATNGMRAADVTASVTQFGGPWGAADNYSSRVSAFFIPPTSGDYIFFLSADDGARLYLSTDEKPANKKWIAQETGWSNQYQWLAAGNGTSEEKRSDSFVGDTGSEWPTPNVITLTAGKKYYIEILHDEGSGGDGSDATFIKSGDPDPTTDAAGMKLKGSVIGTYVNANGASVTITEQPKSVTGFQSGTATFTVVATGASVYGTNVTYQWQQAPKGSANYADIAGATAASYTTPLLTLADDGTSFRVIVKVVAGVTATSEAATLTINVDSTPPTVVSAGAITGTPKVGVAFSELLDTNSAQVAANYSISGATITSAAVRFGKYVELTLAANVTTAPKVTINNVKDLAGNSVASTTVDAELVNNMISSDIGDPGTNPLQAGYGIAAGGGTFLVGGGGNDIWDAADAFHFLYQEFTGPFDARVRVEAMDPTGLSTWAKAELMVRESTAPEAVIAPSASLAPDPQVKTRWKPSGAIQTTLPAAALAC
jgi:hypothetical protein